MAIYAATQMLLQVQIFLNQEVYFWVLCSDNWLSFCHIMTIFGSHGSPASGLPVSATNFQFQFVLPRDTKFHVFNKMH